MRDPNRIKRILALLEEYWETVPDWRLGQLIVNLAPGQRDWSGYADPFMIEDSEWEQILLDKRPKETKNE